MKTFHNARITLFATFIAIALLSFTGVAVASSSLDSPTQWAIYGETTQPNGNLNFHPTGHGMSFSVPDVTSSSPNVVNYLLDTYTVSLTESSVITATFSVTGSGVVENPLWSGYPYYSHATPAFVRLFIQANLPNDHSAFCVGGNGNVENYWWADFASYTFVPGGSGGSVTLAATLSPLNWSGICGNSGSSNVPAFENAIANTKYVGLSFGSGSFFADGVGVDGATGTATFTLLSYTVS